RTIAAIQVMKNDFTFKFTCVLFLCHKIKTLTRWMSNFQGSLQYGGFLFVAAICFVAIVDGI
ncbi:hypothetical protein, partial [Vibrio cholerae]